MRPLPPLDGLLSVPAASWVPLLALCFLALFFGDSGSDGGERADALPCARKPQCRRRAESGRAARGSADSRTRACRPDARSRRATSRLSVGGGGVPRSNARGTRTPRILAHALAACAWAASGRAAALGPGPVPPPAAPSQIPRLSLQGPLKSLLGSAPDVDLSVGVNLVGLPGLSREASPLPGMASASGAALRVRRPRDRRALLGASPWVDAEALRVADGPGARRGLALGAGLSFPLGHARTFWVGPFVRYVALLEPGAAGIDGRASDGLFVGCALELLSPGADPRDGGAAR